MASIRAYKDGLWRAQIRRAGYKPRSKVFTTEKAAKAWARAIELEMDKAHYFDPGTQLKTTIGEVLVRFATEVAPLRKGGRWEKVRLPAIARTADFARRRLGQLRHEDLRAWRDQRLKEVKPATVNRELNMLSGVLNYAIKEWSLPLKENPFSLVKRPPPGKPRRRRWSDAELKAVLQAANFDEDNPPTKLYGQGRLYVGWAVLLAIETAMRLGELSSVHIRDIDLEGRCIKLGDTKNGESRDVPLSRRAIELLSKLMQGRKASDKLFPMCGDSLGLYYREARNKAKVEDLHFHDTRHEAATRLSRKFSNVLELSAVTGHRSLQSLKIYYNPTASELAAKLD